MPGPWEKYKAESSKPAGPWEKYGGEPEGESSIGRNLLGGAVQLGRRTDSVSGAPTRSSISNFMDTKSPIEAAKAFGRQFHEAPETAPTGADIATKMGFSTDRPTLNFKMTPDQERLGMKSYSRPGASNAEMAGEVINVVADPLLPLSIGASALAKGTGKALKYTNRALFGIKQAENAPEIGKAMSVIGAKATPGQLISSPLVKKLENTMAHGEGQLGGIFLRRNIEKSKEEAGKIAAEIAKDRSFKSNIQSGLDFENKFKEELSKKLEPAEQIYNAWEDALRQTNLPISKGGILNTIKDLKEETKFSDKAQAILADAELKIKGKPITEEELITGKIKQTSLVNNLDDLKKYRTSIGNELSNPALDANERYALSNLYAGLSDLRSDSLKELVKSSQTKEFAQEALKQLSEADKIWKSSSEEVGNALLGKGKNAKFGPQKTTEQFFDRNTEIQRLNKALQTNDPSKIAKIKEDFPQAFEVLKQSRIEEMVRKAEHNGKIDYGKLTKMIDKMPKESQNLIFGEEKQKKIQALKVYLESIPPNINPSGTAFAHQILDMLNPYKQAMSVGRSLASSALTAPELGTDVFSKLGNSKYLAPILGGSAIGSKASINRKQKGLSLPGRPGVAMPISE